MEDTGTKFCVNIGETLCLDDSRRHVIHEAGKTLELLVQGRLKSMNRYRRLLLGRKGVGKTTLLKELLQVAQKHFPTNLVPIYVTCLDGPDSISDILSIIARECGYKQDQLPNGVVSVKFKELEDFLEKNGQFVFLVVDEVHVLFQATFPQGKRLVHQLAMLGDTSGGRIHCILSGSSSVVRQLCFGKLPAEEKEKFPNYEGMDMNSTKYTARWIYPFLEANDFALLVNHVASKLGKTSQFPASLEGLYLSTGGNPSLVESSFIGEVDPYVVSSRKYLDRPQEKALLSAVYHCAQSLTAPESDDDELKGIARWTAMVPYSAVRDQLSRSTNSIDDSLVYNLADSGLLRFDDAVVLHRRVSLGSPLIFLELHHQYQPENLTLRQLFALAVPASDPDTAENLALTFLARALTQKKLEAMKDVLLKNDKTGRLELPEIGTRRSTATRPTSPGWDTVPCYKLEDISDEDLEGRLFKEVYGSRHKDVLGSDAVVLTKIENGNWSIDRIQLKLGRSNMKADVAEQIIQRFTSMVDTLRTIYASGKRRVVSETCWLVTTRPIAPDVSKIFKDSDIHVVESAELSSKVWPENVRLLGKPYC